MPSRVWRVFRARLLGGFSWNLLVVGSSQGSLFVTHLVVARVLGVTEFGTYALLLSTALAVGAIAQSGSGFVAAKYVAEYHMLDKARAASVLGVCRFAALSLGGACGLVLIAASQIVAEQLLRHPEMANGLRVLGIAIPFLALNAYQQGALQGFGAFRASGITGTFAGAAHVAIVWFGASIAGVDGVLVAVMISAILRSLLFAHALRIVEREHEIAAIRFGRMGEAPLLWKMGLPAALMGVSVSLAFWLVNVLLARGPSGTEAVGQFFAANQLRLLALQIPTILAGVSVSVLNRLRGHADWLAYRNVFLSNLAINVLVASVLVIASVVLAGPLVSIYGAGFAVSRELVQVFMLSVVPELIAMALFLHVQAYEKMWLSFCGVWLPKDVVFIAGSWVAMASGAIGAAWSYGAAWSVAAVAFALIARRIGFGSAAGIPAPPTREHH